ncbi:hypothetical protein ACFYQA_22705 [Streptomyces sp. NPDC005774]|uniref:hypothetical protein n=1 Tax=Streptomyces sp. NPDC005774 TaxID=3364728 RepID=UPI0036A43A77
MSVSLDKTAQSIAYGRMHAAINRGVRRNNLLALSLEFSERAYRAEVKAFEAHKSATLVGEWGSTVTDAKECDAVGCWAPVRSYEDFCGDACWDAWHYEFDRESYDRRLYGA